MAHTSASMTKTSEELGLSLTTSDSAYIDNIAAADSHHNVATTLLPEVSLSPFPHWNTNETSQYYASTSSNLNIGSSQFNNSQIFQMEEEHKSHPYRPDYGFPYTQQGYTGSPYQHTRHGNLPISDDGRNASFNPTDISANWPQMANPRGSGDIRQSLLNTNLGRTQFNPNQAVEPSLTPGKIYERFISVGSGSNGESESNTIMPKVNVAGNSEREFHPPTNTYHSQLGSRSFSSPDLDMNNAFTGFQKDGGTSSNFANAGHHESPPFNSKNGLHLGSSYGFPWPTVGDQSHHLRQANRDSMPRESRQRRVDGQLVPLSIAMVTDQSPSEILPENNGNFSSRSIPIPPLVVDTRSTRVQNPSSHNGQSQVVGSIQQSSLLPRQQSASDQAIQTRTGQQVSRPPFISSLKRPASQPLTYTLQDHQRRKTVPTQPFIHQSVPTRTGLIHTARSPTLQATQSSFSPLLPYTLSLPNTTQVIAPPIHPNQQQIAQSQSRQGTPLMPPLPSQQLMPQSLNQQMIAQSLARQGRPTIPPVLPNQQLIAQSLASQGTPLIMPPPLLNQQQLVAQFLARQQATRQHTLLRPPSLPNQQLAAQSLARQQTLRQHTAPVPPPLLNQRLAVARQRTLLIPPPATTTGSYIKYKDQTPAEPEASGYKCLLCKRDLSYEPEGPISQPPIRPTVAVLSCGHTFHEYCLERITPDHQSKDPPCIPCALLD